MNTVTFYKPRRKKISLTALIDVVFILLMFFMLSSSFSQWQAIDFDSPITGESATTNETLFLFLNNDLSIELSDGSIQLNESAEFSKQHADLVGSKPVLIIPEEDVSVQALISTFEQLKKSGLTMVSLGNSRPSRHAPQDSVNR